MEEDPFAEMEAMIRAFRHTSYPARGSQPRQYFGTPLPRDPSVQVRSVIEGRVALRTKARSTSTSAGPGPGPGPGPSPGPSPGNPGHE